MNKQDQGAAGNNGWQTVKIVSKEPAAEGVMRFELRPTESGCLPEFSAGAHIDVRLPNGAVRQYSLCNDPSERDRYEIAVLLDPSGRGGSRSAHVDLSTGDLLQISVPRNQFPLHPARHSILLAGGIGITPMLSMAEQLTQDGASFELHYCARSNARMAYKDRILRSHYAGQTYFHFDDGDPIQRFDANQVLAHPDVDVHLYVCGPQGFMDYVINSARQLHWADTSIHFEYFSAPKVTANGRGEFEVQLASSGMLIKVPAGKSIAQALGDAGIAVPLSCEQGICGTCLVGVLDGIPEHRDYYLSEDAKATNRQVTLCCSRALSPRLVLDL